MQALGLFSRRAILGRSNKNTVVLEKIAKENSLNRTGAVNFNKMVLASCHAMASSWIAFCCMSTSQIRQRRPTRKLVWLVCAFGHCLKVMACRNVKLKSCHP